jgi:hypothetical protein
MNNNKLKKTGMLSVQLPVGVAYQNHDLVSPLKKITNIEA